MSLSVPTKVIGLFSFRVSNILFVNGFNSRSGLASFRALALALALGRPGGPVDQSILADRYPILADRYRFGASPDSHIQWHQGGACSRCAVESVASGRNVVEARFPLCLLKALRTCAQTCLCDGL